MREECQVTFHSPQASGDHRFKIHGYRQEFRTLVDTSHCLVCRQEFTTIERCIHHLTVASDRCALVHLAMTEALPDEVQEQVDAGRV